MQNSHWLWVCLQVKVLFAENDWTLQKIVEEFDSVCKRSRLRVNAIKSKVMVIDFGNLYRVGAEDATNCTIWLEEKRLEEVIVLNYLGTVLCKYGSMEGELRERAVKGRQAVGVLKRVMKGKKCEHGCKEGYKIYDYHANSCHVYQMWTVNAAQQSIIHAVEISYTKTACGVSGWDGESNESVYEQFGMGVTNKGMVYGVVEWVKCELSWFGHMMRKGGEEIHEECMWEGLRDGVAWEEQPPVM